MPDRRWKSRKFERDPRRLAAVVAFGGAVSLLAPALGAVLGGCSSESGGTTTGRRVSLATRIELAPGGGEFETALGWSVSLTRAYVSLGVLRYFDGVPPIAGRAVPAADRAFALWLFGLGTAHAHPGHYEPGNVLGEMLVPSTVDLLAGTTALADGQGVTGAYRSARFTLTAPPQGELAGDLDEYVAVTEGSAEKSGQAKRWFRAVADLAEVEDSAPRGEVDGCVFETFHVEGDGTVTVRVAPSEWFTLVDFSVLEPGEPGEPSEFQPGTQPRIAFAQGVAELSAYRFSFNPVDLSP